MPLALHCATIKTIKEVYWGALLSRYSYKDVKMKCASSEFSSLNIRFVDEEGTKRVKQMLLYSEITSSVI